MSLPALAFGEVRKEPVRVPAAYGSGPWPVAVQQKATLFLSGEDAQALGLAVGCVNRDFWVLGDWVAPPETVLVQEVWPQLTLTHSERGSLPVSQELHLAVKHMMAQVKVPAELLPDLKLESGVLLSFQVARTIWECEDGVRRRVGWNRLLRGDTKRYERVVHRSKYMPLEALGAHFPPTTNLDGNLYANAEDIAPALAARAAAPPEHVPRQAWRSWESSLYDAPDDEELRLVYCDWLEDHDWPGRAVSVAKEIWHIRKRKGTLDPVAVLCKRAQTLRRFDPEHGAEWSVARLARRLRASRERAHQASLGRTRGVDAELRIRTSCRRWSHAQRLDSVGFSYLGDKWVKPWGAH